MSHSRRTPHWHTHTCMVVRTHHRICYVVSRFKPFPSFHDCRHIKSPHLPTFSRFISFTLDENENERWKRNEKVEKTISATVARFGDAGLGSNPDTGSGTNWKSSSRCVSPKLINNWLKCHLGANKSQKCFLLLPAADWVSFPNIYSENELMTSCWLMLSWKWRLIM